MKLIKQLKNSYYDEYYYENNILERVDIYKEITWFKNGLHHKEDGASKQNCHFCKNQYHTLLDNNSYNRHFYINGIYYYPKQFAEETKHKICLVCLDFCNQKCFLGEV